MSGVFDKFMGSYVLLERRNLEELLQKLAQVTGEHSLLLTSSFFFSLVLCLSDCVLPSSETTVR